ncbi:MAG TPA: hypothetical protein DCP92_13760 [Nitrospiraceae bacterium]|nr:hypothetical protein [Nitrospiraceae bacterium]
MKKVIVLIVSVLFVLTVAGLSFAADTTAPAAPAEQAAPAKKIAKVHQITGEVSAVDATAKTLTVKSKKAEEALTADDKVAAKLADVKVGDKVMVKFKEMDGKKVAISLVEKKAPAKKAMPAEKPATEPAK